MAPSRSLLRPGVTASVVLLRALLLVLPCGALALALPERPHWAVLLTVPVASAAWARLPEHAVGIVPLVFVGGWFAARGIVDWKVLVVAALLLGAHVAATLVSYGPATLVVDPGLVRLWAGRALLALVPVPLAWLAVRELDAGWAPSWLWLLTGVTTVVLLLATARLTRSEPA